MCVDLLGQQEEHLVEAQVDLRLDLGEEELLPVHTQRVGGRVVVRVHAGEEHGHQGPVALLQDVLRQDPRQGHGDRKLSALAELEVELAQP